MLETPRIRLSLARALPESLQAAHPAHAIPAPHSPYAIAAEEDRCSERIPVSIPATLRPKGMRGHYSVVSDLSLGGFRASAAVRMHPGSYCWLTLPGLESLEATVVWWERSEVGCAFSRLLNPIVLENILARGAGGAPDGGSLMRWI